MSRFWRYVLAVLVVATVYGGCFLLEAQPARNTGWPAYLGLALLAGLVGVVGESVADRIMESDLTSDPFHKRLPRLALLLLGACGIGGALYAIIRNM